MAIFRKLILNGHTWNTLEKKTFKTLVRIECTVRSSVVKTSQVQFGVIKAYINSIFKSSPRAPRIALSPLGARARPITIL